MGYRKCLRCKEEKKLVKANFGKRQRDKRFEPSWDRICLDCRSAELGMDKEELRENKPLKLRTCRNPNCSIKINRHDNKVYCSEECLEEARLIRIQEKKTETRIKNEENQEKIPEKYLVRGRIYGVDYR